MLSLSNCVRLFVTQWTHQVPLSMGFSKQEYWSGLSCPPPGDLPNPRTKPTPLTSPALASRLFTTRATWEDPMLLLLLSCFSRVWLVETPWTAAYQAPPSIGFSRQEYWSGLPLPSPEDPMRKGQFTETRSWLVVTCGYLTEAKDIKKRWQEYTELYKKDLHDPDNHDVVITHLEPDILECEVKWTLGSITTNKASGGDGIPVKLFQILKDDVWKCCTQYVSKFGKLSSGHGTGKGQFSFQSQRKAMPKNAQTTAQLHSSHMLVMLKILQARLQQTWTMNFQIYKLDLEKVEEPEIKFPKSTGS